ncbi:CoA pyrophosphatase [Methyloversatilis sp. XJ19-13]|uniref:CoA pyrophosphatase n=1 Tax=Methyloversatilis sp. XJ19-13 TaxID=2963430 RepID=UPI00211BEEA1|nr:CoA pyrophosphatase [Methyloversatilis sp. XJ19-13]MCQ9374494.1 CoA pyrophosphatase [Methyloversatilis sp. XJ19-13]
MDTPVLSSAGFDPHGLRSRLHALQPCPIDERFAGFTPAAVLVPVVIGGAEPTLLLTRRSAHLYDHPGQIAFPGGRVDPGDVSPEATALREAQEEIGLAAGQVELIGRLPDYFITASGFRVTPVVGLLHAPLVLRLDPFEVAEAFETPLSFLIDPSNRTRGRIEHEGVMREYWAMPWQGYDIWGATAGMIVSFAEHLLADPPLRR